MLARKLVKPGGWRRYATSDNSPVFFRYGDARPGRRDVQEKKIWGQVLRPFANLLFLLVASIVAGGCNRPVDPHVPPDSLITSVPLASPAGRADGQTLFRELTAEQTGLDFQMQLYDPIEQIRVLMFLNANGGICTGDFDGDGLADIYVTSPVGGNRLYRNLGNLRFEDVTVTVGVADPKFWGTGATFVDIDDDGDLDIYACAYDMPNHLWVNDGGQFTERAREFGLDFSGASMTMAFADIDNDGDLDGYLATTAKQPPAGTKFGVRFEGKKPVIPDELREYWELIYLPGDRAHRTEAGQFDHLFRNDGKRFTEITKEAGIDGPYFSLSATWWDYNQDGFPDVYVSNDYMGPDKLYHNNGDGTFADVIGDVTGHTPWFSMGSDVGDLNNDGLLDFFASDMSATSHYRDKVMMGNMEDTGWFLDFAEPRQYMRNVVYLNSGVERMLDVAFQSGLSSSDWTWTPRLEDFDNDGRVDVFATNGILRDAMNADLSEFATKSFQGGSHEWAEFWAKQPMYKEANQAFRNLGHLKFENVATEWGLDRKGVSFGAASADFDNDGDLDLVVNNADAKVSLYENRSDTGSRIRVRLKGTRSNRFGVGATVRLKAGGQAQTRYLTLARGWLSACEPVLHFGLADALNVEQLTVSWPSGHQQSFQNLDAGRIYMITEPSGSPVRVPSSRSLSQPTALSQQAMFEESGYNSVAHRENEFDDFALQPLLPNRQSQFGPALALADIDADGDVDAFLGGARDMAAQLLINTGTSFSTNSPPDFVLDAESEDVAAAFLDVDGDADQDLLVVSGSNEWPEESPRYLDRLYLNDGRGQFSRARAWLPDHRDNGSCVAAADCDADGDIDLFVGGRAVPGAYPVAAASRLLINEGTRLVDVTPAVFEGLGIVTDAIWTDVNGDDRLDLVLATEWGPVRCLVHQDGQWFDRTDELGLGEYLGWWNSIAAGDIDGDGDMDFVVTNFGWNTKYKATKEKPESLYFGDLDGTGKPHIVEAKLDGDIRLPRRGFSCSKNAMPFLQSKMQTFHNFASSTLDELYTPQRLDQCRRFEVNTLASGLLVNNGVEGFTFRALPWLAQIAPSMDAVLVDVNQDAHLDIVMAQNFYSPQRETGRMDSGLCLLLVGDGKGDFAPVWPHQSGISLPHDTRKVAAADVDGDGQSDLVFAANNGPMTVLLNTANAPTTVD